MKFVFNRQNLLWLAYPLAWTLSLCQFWLFDNRSDALGFTIFLLYLLHPIVIFLVSAIVGIISENRSIWLVLPLVLSFGYMLCDFLTFRLANMIAFSKLTAPEFVMIPVGLFISVSGLLLGLMIKSILLKK